jgi:nucleoid-associated protein YgaU
MLAGCMAQQPALRSETKLLLDRAQLNEAAQVLPEEYSRVVSLVNAADLLHRRGQYKEAERTYDLAWKNGKALEDHLRQEQLRRTHTALSRTETELLAVSRQRAILEDQRRLALDEQLKTEAAKEPAAPIIEPKVVKTPLSKERPLLAVYSVKRGESLPQIAARPEVYGESQLWPLLYRANRDQISDPRRIWPGQPLRIPRNNSSDDLAEARRFAQKSTIF